MIVSIDPPATIARGGQVAKSRRPVDTNRQPPWHTEFLRLVPSIRRHAQIRFRHVNPADREDAVQEVIARSLLQFLRLLEQGKEHLIFAGPLAHYAVAQFRGGRRVGGRLNVHDVSSPYCRARKGVTLDSLDRIDETSDLWQEVLVEDRHATPADVAAARIDVRDWLATLPKRSRCLAERLATGESTSGAAQMFGVSRSRVSQLRCELHCAWNTFQGDRTPALQQNCGESMKAATVDFTQQIDWLSDWAPEFYPRPLLSYQSDLARSCDSFLPRRRYFFDAECRCSALWRL